MASPLSSRQDGDAPMTEVTNNQTSVDTASLHKNLVDAADEIQSMAMVCRSIGLHANAIEEAMDNMAKEIDLISLDETREIFDLLTIIQSLAGTGNRLSGRALDAVVSANDAWA